jgi:hypothetical protein
MSVFTYLIQTTSFRKFLLKGLLAEFKENLEGQCGLEGEDKAVNVTRRFIA